MLVVVQIVVGTSTHKSVFMWACGKWQLDLNTFVHQQVQSTQSSTKMVRQIGKEQEVGHTNLLFEQKNWASD